MGQFAVNDNLLFDPLTGRLAGEYPRLREAAEHAEAGSQDWCAAQFWLGWTAHFSNDLAAALGHFTALRDTVEHRPPSRALAEALTGRGRRGCRAGNRLACGHGNLVDH